MKRRLALDRSLESSPCCREPLTPWARVRDYPIERCEGCGSAFVNPRPSVGTMHEYYASGGHGENTATSVDEVLQREQRYPNSTLDARRIVGHLDRLAPGRRLLDVGSGHGFFSREARERGFEVDAIEPASFERRCTREVAGIEPFAGPFEKFEGEGGRYDAVLMSQILEHVVDLRRWMLHTRHLLRPHGVLAVALPNFGSIVRMLLGHRDPMIHPPDHLNFFNRQGLRRLLSEYSMQEAVVHSVSRVPGYVLSDRIALPGTFQASVERVFEAWSGLLLCPVDRVGRGMFLNVFATLEPSQ